ncbi:MAG: hypothetical protein IJA46_04840, partial [Bacteroidaceae bacterium]|nr:hypothetical protein [Bacteroidaceae bacterium]
ISFLCGSIKIVNIFQTNNSYSNVCQWNSYIFYPCTKRGWWLNKIKEGDPILLLGHPHHFFVSYIPQLIIYKTSHSPLGSEESSSRICRI